MHYFSTWGSIENFVIMANDIRIQMYVSRGFKDDNTEDHEEHSTQHPGDEDLGSDGDGEESQ